MLYDKWYDNCVLLEIRFYITLLVLFVSQSHEVESLDTASPAGKTADAASTYGVSFSSASIPAISFSLSSFLPP